MNLKRLLALGVLGSLALCAPPAQARVFVGVGIGVPVYRPYWGPRYYYPYRPYYYDPVIIAPAPVVLAQPAPVVVQPAPVVVAPAAQPAVAVQPAPTVQSTSASPTPEPPLLRSVSTDDRQNMVGGYLQRLSHPDENVRSDAALRLGRLKATQAVDPLAATLAGDRSAAVRETAARALGLIGSPQALTALTHAAQADADRDVRRSAQFAVEVIQANQQR